MERRSFFKIVGTASGGLLTGACGKQARQIIPLLVPEQEIVIGEEEWHPSVCRECSAGCGTIVRVMRAEREVKRGNDTVRERIAAVKKIEGNPLDPVSGGALCARGQAGVQALYHPDRLRGPMKRSGQKGDGAFEAISWDSAIDSAASALKSALDKDPSKIVYLARPQAGTRSATTAAFLKGVGAPAPISAALNDFEIERKAAEAVFGWNGLPVYDLQDSDYVLGVGADFLGGWVSPVFYARRFGQLRQGRVGRRGRLIQAESRLSLTATSADRWLPVRPGGELAFALAVGHVLVEENLLPASVKPPSGIREGFAAVSLDTAARMSGLQVAQIRQVARELAQAEAPVVVSGASVVQTNSLDAVIAANALNLLLGSVGRKGGVIPPSAGLIDDAYEKSRPDRDDLFKRLDSAQVVLLDGVNPAYTLPGTAKLLAKVPTVLSFSPFLDDSAAYADLILPDHAGLESAAAVIPSVAPEAALTGAGPVVRPLYETRATEQVLADIGKKLGKEVTVETPQSAYQSIFAQLKPAGDWTDAGEFAQDCQRQGGWWTKIDRKAPAASKSVAKPAVPQLSDAVFQGGAGEFPYYFQPYPSVQFGDGSGAHLPWMQELPDPASSAMWGLPVEIDPQSAAKLGLANGQAVRVVSPQGSIEAAVYVHPGAIPGVLSMAIGQGHKHYGRFASGQGANPLEIAAPVFEAQSGAFAFGATRVRIEKLRAEGGLVQFSMADREPDLHRR